jgi:hypothetical protein
MKILLVENINWWTIIIVPILITLSGAVISYLFNRSKTKAEINKMIVEADKTEVEINKLREETRNLKRTFQPVVISTLQSVQDKVLDDKIFALRRINALYSKFIEYPQQYDEGDPVTPSKERQLDLLFRSFDQALYQEFKEFHNQYSYVFSDTAFNNLKHLYESLGELSEINISWHHEDDGLIVPNNNDIKLIKRIIEQFAVTQTSIRKDCYLDSEFIHEFLSENKI